MSGWQRNRSLRRWWMTQRNGSNSNARDCVKVKWTSAAEVARGPLQSALSIFQYKKTSVTNWDLLKWSADETMIMYSRNINLQTTASCTEALMKYEFRVSNFVSIKENIGIWERHQCNHWKSPAAWLCFNSTIYSNQYTTGKLSPLKKINLENIVLRIPIENHNLLTDRKVNPNLWID